MIMRISSGSFRWALEGIHRGFQEEFREVSDGFHGGFRANSGGFLGSF